MSYGYSCRMSGDTLASPQEVVRLTDAVERLRLAEAGLGRRRAGETGLNDADRAAVRYITELGDRQVAVTPTMLARQLHLSPAAVTNLVDRLVAKGLVSLEPNPADRRSKFVVTTNRALDPDHIDPLTARLRTICAGLTPGDAAIIADFLDQVTAAVAERPPSEEPERK